MIHHVQARKHKAKNLHYSTLRDKFINKISGTKSKGKLKHEVTTKKIFKNANTNNQSRKVSHLQKMSFSNSYPKHSKINISLSKVGTSRHDHKALFEDSSDNVNLKFPNTDTGQKQKFSFQSKSGFLNLKNMIPKVEELIEKKNLGNVEKIIVYVDKDEMKKDSKAGSKKDNDLPKLTSSQENILNQNSGKSEVLGKSYNIYLNGASLDEVISFVADKVIQSIDPTKYSTSFNDSKLVVKVIQPVAYGTETPQEETKTEFTVNLSSFNKGSNSDYTVGDRFLKNVFLDEHQSTQFKTPSHQKSKQNFDPNGRLGVKIKISSTNKRNGLEKNEIGLQKNRKSFRKMNLPIRHSMKRKYWHEKMREDEGFHEKNLAKIHKYLLEELNNKLKKVVDHRYNHGEEDLVRDKRKVSNQHFKKVKKHRPKNSNINEKNKIMYALHNMNTISHGLKDLMKSKENSKLRNSPQEKVLLEKSGLDSKIKGSKFRKNISEFREKSQNRLLRKKRKIQGKFRS